MLECDITDQQQTAGAVARTVAELGRLDALINNAGVMLPHLLRAAGERPRQEVARQYVPISLVELGATAAQRWCLPKRDSYPGHCYGL